MAPAHEPTAPVNPRAPARNHVAVGVRGELREKVRKRCGLPQEFVDLARAAVAGEHAQRPMRIRKVRDADISKCFDSITHAHLRSLLDLRIKDGVARRMIDIWLKAGVLEEDALHRPVASVDPGTEPVPHISDRQFLDPLPDSLQNVGETCLNPLPSPSRGLRLDVSFDDGINRQSAYRPYVPVCTAAPSRRVPEVSRSTRSSGWNCARATVSAGHATTRTSVS